MKRSEEDQNCICSLQNQLFSKEKHIEFMEGRLKEVTERNAEMERLVSDAEQLMCKVGDAHHIAIDTTTITNG